MHVQSEYNMPAFVWKSRTIHGARVRGNRHLGLERFRENPRNSQPTAKRI